MALPPAVLEGVLGAPKGGQNGEQAVECLACGERLPSARALVTHLVRRHFRGAAFPCPSCGVAVVTVRQLQHHLRRHAGERLHPCARCARPFATMFTLRRHQRLNRCGARHACARCGRSFASAALLDKHGRKHEPRRRGAGKCAKCGTRFAVRAELYAHERSIHGDLRPYPCDLCEFAFYKRTGLLKHVQRAHATTTASRLHLHAAPLTPPPSPPPSHSAAPERPDDLELPWPSPGTPSIPSGPAEPALQHDGLEHPPPKKRGRPRKSDKSALRQDGVENLTNHPPPKKRGRPRKSEQCDKHEGSENPSPKKRGRPRKSEQSANSPPKKRGRPRKSEQRDKSCSEKQTEGPSDTLRTLPGPSSSSSSSHSPPRKRGRARRPEQGDRRCHARLSVRLFGKTAESRLEKWRRIQLVRRQSMELRRLAPLSLPPALAPLCLPPALAPLCLPPALTPLCLPPAPLARLNDAALPPKKRGRPRKAEQSDSPSAGKGAKLRAKLSGKPKRPLNGKRNLKTSLKLDSKLNARLCVEITGLSRKHLETLTGVEFPEKRLGTPRTSPLLGIPEPNVYSGPPAPEGTTTLAPAPLEQGAGVENSPPKKRGRPPKSEKNIKSSVQLSGKTTKTQLDKPSSKHNLKKSLKMSNRLTARLTPAVPLDGVENAPPKRRPGRPRKPEGRPETEPKLSGDQSAATRVKLSGMPCRKQLVKLSVAKPRAKVQVGGKWTRQACKPLGSVQGFSAASAAPSGSKNGLKEGVRSGPKSRVKWVCAECGARFPLEWSLKGHLLHTHLQHARLSVR